jgi:hypothetical protein
MQAAALTPTYKMVKRITNLSQHYLTNESPILRRQLLNLAATSCLSLSSNEDEYLPLINDLWPVVFKRLQDEEQFVVVAAAEAISKICETCGDFLASRIQDGWPDIMKIIKQVQRKVASEGNARRRFSPSGQLYDALTYMFISILESVRISDEMADDAIELMMPLLARRTDVRMALEHVNPDALWLAMQTIHKPDSGTTRAPPHLDGVSFTDGVIA